VYMQLVRPLLDAQPSGPESHRRKLAEDCCPAGFVKVAQITVARPGRRFRPKFWSFSASKVQRVGKLAERSAGSVRLKP